MFIKLFRYCVNLCFVFFVVVMVNLKSTLADAPSTSCPLGFTAVAEPDVTIAISCPSAATAIEESPVPCLIPLASDYPSCIMYVPVGMSFTDNGGTYEFSDVCAME